MTYEDFVKQIELLHDERINTSCAANDNGALCCLQEDWILRAIWDIVKKDEDKK